MSSQTSLSAAAAPAVVAIDENSSGDDSVTINSPNRWFFDKEKLESTPSRKCGIDSDKELTYRQQSANFIQDIGQRLQVNQLCINTAIVYMHRFYMFHSFSHFHRNAVSTASIFLAAKVEEQPRKLEHVIKVAHYCLHRETQPQIDIKSEQYLEQSSELVMNENVLLQTLGFDVAIDHPHTHVVKCCQLVRASKDLAQTSYFMATNSLHLTTMCLQYKPTVVACVCIHLACKWSNWEIPRSKEGKDWFWYVDDTVTTEQLETMTTEFLTIFNKSPSRLKKKMMSLNQVSGAANLSLSSFPSHLGVDPTSPGAPNFPKSRSPSPAGSSKRLAPMKPAGSQQILPSKSAKPHSNMPHHGMKPHSGHHGPPPASGSNKHVHPSAGKPSYHVSHPHGFSLHSAKDSHPQQAPQPMKDGHQSLHGKHPNALHHPHGIPPPYPHGARPNAQLHHGQTHSGQKPLPPGSHQPHVGYTSKIPPLNPSKPPHNMNMPKPNVIGGSANKNSMSAHPPPVKKPYHEGYGTKEEMLNRRSNPNPNQQQQRPRPSEKPDLRHHQPTVQGGQLPNSAHPVPHGGDHSRSWTEHASAFGASNDSSGSRNEKPNPAVASKNVMSADYYQRHRADNAPDKRMASGAQVANNLGSSGVGNVVDRNDNLSIIKVDNMDDPFNQIVSKVNANNSYYPAINSGGGNVNLDSNVPSFKNKQGLHATTSSVSELAGFAKNEDDQLQITPSVTAMPDNKNKRRHTEGLMDIRNPTSSKRPRSDAHTSLGSGFPTLSDELLVDSKKALNSKSSPPHVAARDNRRSNSAFQKGMHLPEAITPFGNDSKSDISKLSLPSLSMELQPPELIEPFGENPANSLAGKSQNLSRGSIFSPKLSDTPSISSIKQEVVGGSAKSSSSVSLKPSNNSSYFSSNSGVSINSNSGHNGAQGIISTNTGTTHFSDTTLSGVLPDAPAPLVARALSNETSSSEHHKKSKKSKKEKHKHKDKHKDKDEKKHKKEKHRDKDREKHKSRDKRRSVDAVETVEVKPATLKPLKISIGGTEKHVKDKESKPKHSSSTKRVSEEYAEEMRAKVSSASLKPTQSLKVKIVNKERVRSLDEEPQKSKSSSRLEQQNQHSQGQSTPCCPGFGPCTNPNCNQSQGPIKMKIPKEKITGASAARPKESKETKKSKKDKEPKVKDKAPVSSNSVVTSKNSGGRMSNATSNHGHKNGVEKVTRKRESSSNL